jgi:serine phosphatase RsbU (regulator of sigma subunit)
MGGPPLGLVETTKYKTGAITLAPGDRLLVVTDGFTEAHDPDGAMYGEARIEEFMTALPATETEPLKRLASLVRGFESGRPAFDDMAAILLSFEALSPP